MFGFIISYTYIALWQERPGLGGYDVAAAVTFVWLTQSLLVPVAVFGGGFHDEMAERIRTGDIAVDLYRPVSLQGWRLAEDAGRAAFHLLARGVAPTVIGALVFDLRWPAAPLTWLAFLLAVALAVVVSFAIRYLIALSGFWLLDARGVQQLVGIAAMFLSGMLLPLVVFPGWLGDVAMALPFAALIQVPIDVFLGEHTGAGLLGALAFQAGWAAVLLGAGALLTRRATRRVVVQGG